MRFYRQLCFWCLFAAASCAASTAIGGEPNRGYVPAYVILVPPSVAPHPGHAYPPPAYGHGVAPRGYAYGWFGVQSRQHWTKHHGYYGIYTQWTAR